MSTSMACLGSGALRGQRGSFSSDGATVCTALTIYCVALLQARPSAGCASRSDNLLGSDFSCQSVQANASPDRTSSQSSH